MRISAIIGQLVCRLLCILGWQSVSLDSAIQYAPPDYFISMYETDDYEISTVMVISYITVGNCISGWKWVEPPIIMKNNCIGWDLASKVSANSFLDCQ